MSFLEWLSVPLCWVGFHATELGATWGDRTGHREEWIVMCARRFCSYEAESISDAIIHHTSRIYAKNQVLCSDRRVSVDRMRQLDEEFEIARFGHRLCGPGCESPPLGTEGGS